MCILTFLVCKIRAFLICKNVRAKVCFILLVYVFLFRLFNPERKKIPC